MPEAREFQSQFMYEIFDGFHNRMKVNSVAQAIGVSSHVITDTIKEKLNSENPEKLDSLLIATLLFIKNKELAEEPCRLEEISRFYASADMRYFFPWLNSGNSFEFAKFIVINILQNRGAPFRKQTVNPMSDNGTTEVVFRLLDEKNQSYFLTEQARDYIYRTNEIDIAFEYSVSVFKIREDIHKKNYSKAMQQTIELMDQIKQLKRSMESFIVKCKTDITSVASDHYSSTIESYHELMKKETNSLTEIQKSVQKDINEIQERLNESDIANDKKALKNLATLQAITENLSNIISTQQDFINYTNKWRDKYQDILDNNMKFSIYEHLNFKKDIVERLVKTKYPLDAALYELLSPLLEIRIPRHLSLESLLEPAQTSIKKEDPGTDLSLADNNSEGDNRKDNQQEDFIASIYREIIEILTEMLLTKDDFYVSDLIELLDITKLQRFSYQQILGEVLSTLYQENPIDIKKIIQKEPTDQDNTAGEAHYKEIYESLAPIKRHLRFIVESSNDTIKYSIYKEGERVEFAITNYHFSRREGRDADE